MSASDGRLASVASGSNSFTVGLDPEQAAAVLASHGPVCIHAGAGTGKTRTITHRIARLVDEQQVAPTQVLAVTFTARAASEMRSRLLQLGVRGVQARTFHSAALRQLRYFWPRHFGGALPELTTSKFRLVGQAASRCRLSTEQSMVRDLAGEVEWARSCLVDAADYPAAAAAVARESPAPVNDVAKVIETYEALKRKAQVIDFEDILMSMAFMIEAIPQVADEVRRAYRSFVIDEYQDVNPLQQRLLDAWLGQRDTLCVVGDPNQTIYTFTGARPDYLLSFAQRYHGAHTVRLFRDYRSTPQVVDLANIILGPSSSGHSAADSLIGQQPDGPPPTRTAFDDEISEAAAAATRCAELIATGTAPSQIAILFRINAQSEVYEQALSFAKVPYVLRGGEKFFDRAEVREAVSFLRTAEVNQQERSEDEVAKTVRRVLSGTGWDENAPPNGGAARERWESLAALANLADDLGAAQTQPAPRLTDFVRELEQRAASQHAPTIEGVTLASLHAAKGLEWDAVLMVGVHDGMLPLNRARTTAQIAEERRLMYVGITRARRILHLSWALARTPGARASRKPSRFLDALNDRRDRPATVPSKRKTRISRCQGCGQPLQLQRVASGVCVRCAEVGDDTFEQLRGWRMGKAREEQIAPYMVFDDETLGSIALLKPASLIQLLKVKGVGEVKLGRYGREILDSIVESTQFSQKINK